MRLFSVLSVAIIGVLATLRVTSALPVEAAYENKDETQPDPAAHQIQPPAKPEVTLTKPDPYDPLPTKAYSPATTESSKLPPHPLYPPPSYPYTKLPFTQLPLPPGFLYKGEDFYKQEEVGEPYDDDVHDGGDDDIDDDDGGSFVSYCAKNSFYPSLAHKFAAFSGL